MKSELSLRHQRLILFFEAGASSWIFLKAVHDAKVRPLLLDEARIWGNLFVRGFNLSDFGIPERHALASEVSLFFMKCFGPGKLAASLGALAFTLLFLWGIHRLCRSLKSPVITLLLYGHLCCNGLMGLFFHSVKSNILTLIHSVALMKALNEIENEAISKKGIVLFSFVLMSSGFINPFSALFGVCYLSAMGLRLFLYGKSMTGFRRTRQTKIFLLGLISLLPGLLVSYVQSQVIRKENFGFADSAFHLTRLSQLTSPFSIVSDVWCRVFLLGSFVLFLHHVFTLWNRRHEETPVLHLLAPLITIAAIIFVYRWFDVNFFSPRFVLFLVPVLITWAGRQIDSFRSPVKKFILAGALITLTVGCVFTDPTKIIGVCPIGREVFLKNIRKNFPTSLLPCIRAVPDSSPVVQIYLGAPAWPTQCAEPSWFVRFSNDADSDWKHLTRNTRVFPIFSDGQGNILYRSLKTPVPAQT